MLKTMFEKTIATLLLIQVLAIGFSIIYVATAKDIYVDVNYKYTDSDGSVYHPYRSIQYAIDRAEDNDSIYVFSGIYNESIVVDKSVKIQAIEKQKATIFRNDRNRHTIEILADFVAIEDFSIIADRNCYVSAIYISGNTVTVQGNYIEVNGTAWAIYVDSSSGNTISGNRIEGGKGIWIVNSLDNVLVSNKINNATESGLNIHRSSNIIVYNNNFSGNRYSIYSQDSRNINITNNNIKNSDVVGIEIISGENNVVEKNSVSNNPTGILFDTDNGKIKENIIRYNNIGISLGGAGSIICRNNISRSTLYGIYGEADSYSNIIYENIFKDNNVNAMDNGRNSWDNGTVGNYWDDYNDVDRDRDGIGDFPYRFSGGIDRYPTGAFLKPPDKPSLVSPKDGETNVGLNPTLTVKVSDPDSKYLSVYFYDATNDSLIGERHGITSGGTASLSFRLPYDAVMAWYVVVNDSKLETSSDIWTFSTLPVPPTNNRPVANPGGPYTGMINQQIQFDGTKSYDPDGKIVFYRWNFGDGSGEILDPKPSHSYQKEGRYMVTLTVIDNNGTSDTKITYADIKQKEERNDPPISIPNGPYSGNVSEIIQFDGTKSYDPDGEIVEYVWNFGDGSTGYGVNPTHSYSKPGVYEVRLTVKDDKGKTSTSSTYARITEEKKTPGFTIAFIIIALLVSSMIRRSN